MLGASGSGKSSVVLAGLIPALQEKQHNLVVSYMTPSNNPLAQLQATLAGGENQQPAPLVDSLSLLDIENEWVPKPETAIELAKGGVAVSTTVKQTSILIIDQFEELFTLCNDETERREFIAQVLTLTQQQKVVITMRADFWGECAPYRELKELMEARQKLIAPMDGAELRKAMEMQAAQVGLRFEPGLSNTILDDVQGEPGAMPLLQHALLELWKRRHGRWLQSGEYETIGSVRMAIAQTADDVYNTLSLSEQEQVKNIFIRLTRLDDSMIQGDIRRDTRRRVWLDELVPTGSTLTSIKELVNRLAGEGARLVVTSIDSSTNKEEVEVAHEALIRYWPRLLNWLDENRTNLQLRETIRQAALDWERQQKDDNYLVHRGGRLDDAQVLSKQAGFLNQLEANYVNACVELRQRQEAEKEAHRRREIRTAWGVAGGAVVAVIISASLGLMAWSQKREAEITKAEAISQYSLALFDSHKELEALTEGIRAGKIFKEYKVTKPLVLAALQKLVYLSQQRNSFQEQNGLTSIAFSPDGQIIASASLDTNVRLWDTKGKLLKTFQGHQDKVNSVVFSPDGKTIASASDDQTIKLWDLNGNLLQTFKGHQYGVYSVVFSPDGQIIASGGNDQTIKLWDLNGNLLQTFKGHQNSVLSLAFSPNGQTIASASYDSTVKLWDLSGKELQTFKGHQERVPIKSVAFSPDGKIIASASHDKTVKLWDLNGNVLQTFQGHQNSVNSVVFSPDGTTIASAGRDNTVKLWALNGTLLQTLKGHQAWVESVVFSPDGKTIASAGGDNTVKLWNFKSQFLPTFNFTSSSMAFSPDGKTIALARGDVELWDLNGTLLQTLRHQTLVNSVAFSPDGKTITSASNDNTVKLWDLNGTLLQTFSGHQDFVNSVAFSPDGKTITSASNDKTVKLWDLNGTLLQTFSGHQDFVNSVAFSSDGKTIASASNDKTVKLWDLNGTLLRTFQGDQSSFTSLAFSPDGQIIASANDYGIVRFWDLKGKQLEVSPVNQYPISSIVFSPNGKIVAFGTRNSIILWDFDLDSLMGNACDLARDYLKNSEWVEESDRHLCDGISKPQ
ncbi:WD40 repeat domain-containing protein [Nostoc piscinale]|uniref:WD40 repeat domain-containing protein n=1 Tax=Nostoc piscinale TaxID=224012 RepID=UPI000AB6F6C6|nr:WD40 repeat domain-containing protein [Nostoc piscinale]